MRRISAVGVLGARIGHRAGIGACGVLHMCGGICASRAPSANIVAYGANRHSAEKCAKCVARQITARIGIWRGMHHAQLIIFRPDQKISTDSRMSGCALQRLLQAVQGFATSKMKNERQAYSAPRVRRRISNCSLSCSAFARSCSIFARSTSSLTSS